MSLVLWHKMNAGCGGRAGLRLALVEVWGAVWGDRPPGCLPFAPEGIGHAQTHPWYTPPYVVEAARLAKRREEEARAREEQEARERASAPAEQSTTKLSITLANGKAVHSRFVAPGLQGKAEAAAPALYQTTRVRWTLTGSAAVDRHLQEEILQKYRERAKPHIDDCENELRPILPAAAHLPGS